MADKKSQTTDEAAGTQAAADDTAIRAGREGVENLAPTAGNRTAMAMTIDPALATAPPAIQAQAVARKTDELALEEQERRIARTVPFAVGHTIGPADTTTVLLEPPARTKRALDRQLVCPNCDRRHAYTPALQGATIPCLCGTLLDVGLEA